MNKMVTCSILIRSATVLTNQGRLAIGHAVKPSNSTQINYQSPTIDNDHDLLYEILVLHTSRHTTSEPHHPPVLKNDFAVFLPDFTAP